MPKQINATDCVSDHGIYAATLIDFCFQFSAQKKRQRKRTKHVFSLGFFILFLLGLFFVTNIDTCSKNTENK